MVCLWGEKMRLKRNIQRNNNELEDYIQFLKDNNIPKQKMISENGKIINLETTNQDLINWAKSKGLVEE